MRFPGEQHVRALLRERPGLVARFVATSLGRSALSMAGILLIREFLGGIVGERGGLAGSVAASIGLEPALALVATLLVGTFVGASVLAYDNAVVQQRIIKILELGMMERLIRHLLALSVPFFDRQSHGDIVHAVRQDVSELRMVVVSLGRIVMEGLLAAGLFVAALWMSPSLTLLALVALPVALLPIFLVARRTLQRSYAVRKSGYVLFDVILQLLRGIRIIKAYRGEEAEARLAIEKGRRYFDQLIEMVRVRSLAQVVLESLAGLGIAVVVVAGGIQVMRGALEWPALLALLMAVRALHGPLNNINVAFVEIRSRGAAVDRIAALLAARPEVPDAPDAVPLVAPPSVIEFDGVGFAFDGKPVLRDLTFRIQAGEMVGIAGPSGAGKTTLLNLFARFYDPTSGAIRFDGRDLREHRLADVYERIAIVTQDPFLFASTIRENIRCGRPDATDAEVEGAARAAEIHDDIASLPEGYETQVGVGGRGLSTGQAQRINIARALLKNAPILLLDEATSSLDSLAEANVQRAIDRLVSGRTTLVVAHRLSTLHGADRILVLEEGRCVAIAPHAELLATCGLYRRLWETQRLGLAEPAGRSAEEEPPPLDDAELEIADGA